MKCRICGREFDNPRYHEPYTDLCCSHCFTQNFWLMKIKEQHESQNQNKYTIINNTCYYFDKEHPIENTNPEWNGFGGSLFKIQFNSGEYYETNNLWSNGDVPEIYREQLPNNAHFV